MEGTIASERESGGADLVKGKGVELKRGLVEEGRESGRGIAND